MSRLITPDQIRNEIRNDQVRGLGGPGGMGLGVPRPPSLDEMVESFLGGLRSANEKNLDDLPVLKAIAGLQGYLGESTVPKPLIPKILAKIKIGVPETFVKHKDFQEFLKLFASLIAKLHSACAKSLGEGYEDIFLSLVAERFALVIPIE